MKAKLYLFLFTIASIFTAFVSSQSPKPIEEAVEPVAYPVGYIAQTISACLSDTGELFPLPEDFFEHFLQVHTQYEGVHPTVATEFPEEWGVVLVERLPEGRELYQIQSQNREWVFLIITSGYSTMRILDVLPVAINLANQTQDLLETEIWTTERETDGTFAVTKKYEWVRSVENVTQKEYEANPQDYLRTKTVTEKYFINGFCRFERITTEDIPDYAAVIFYYKDVKPDEWEEIVPILQAFCEDYSILFAVVNKNFNQIDLYDYKLNLITVLDITPYIEFQEGVIFMKKNEKPKTVPFGSFERIKIEIKRYFKIVEV